MYATMISFHMYRRARRGTMIYTAYKLVSTCNEKAIYLRFRELTRFVKCFTIEICIRMQLI